MTKVSVPDKTFESSALCPVGHLYYGAVAQKKEIYREKKEEYEGNDQVGDDCVDGEEEKEKRKENEEEKEDKKKKTQQNRR